MWKYNLKKHIIYECDHPFATRKEIPVSGKVDWIDRQEVEDGKDFKITKDYFIRGSKYKLEGENYLRDAFTDDGDIYYRPILIPITQEQPSLLFYCQSAKEGGWHCLTACDTCKPKEQPKESEDDIWRDFSRLYGNWGTISQEFINTIKTQFTITRR